MWLGMVFVFLKIKLGYLKRTTYRMGGTWCLLWWLGPEWRTTGPTLGMSWDTDGLGTPLGLPKCNRSSYNWTVPSARSIWPSAKIHRTCNVHACAYDPTGPRWPDEDYSAGHAQSDINGGPCGFGEIPPTVIVIYSSPNWYRPAWGKS